MEREAKERKRKKIKKLLTFNQQAGETVFLVSEAETREKIPYSKNIAEVVLTKAEALPNRSQVSPLTR